MGEFAETQELIRVFAEDKELIREFAENQGN